MKEVFTCSTEELSFRDAVGEYFEALYEACGKDACINQPSNNLSDEIAGVWHLVNINGRLAKVDTMVGKITLY